MKVYAPADIAPLLDVKESTLRKYSILLEECGYTFQRNVQKQRYYTDNDVIAFRKLITFKDNGDMNLKQAAEAVYLWSRGGDVTEGRTDEHDVITRHDVAMHEGDSVVLELVAASNNYIHQLIDEIDTLKDELQERDERQKKRDDYLIKMIEDLKQEVQQQREEQQLLLEVKEEKSEQEEKNGFWNRFFKK